MIKKIIILILLLFPVVCFGLPINKEYSHRAFPYHGVSFKDIDPAEFNNTIIVNAGFYQEWQKGDKEVMKDIFPDGMTGVIFRECNLDNVFVPEGNHIEGGSNRAIKVQNDLEDWLVDSKGDPVEPLHKEKFLEAGVSIDPADIPQFELNREQRDQFEAVLDQRAVEPEPEPKGGEAGFSAIWLMPIIAILFLLGIPVYKIAKKFK
jgi:hypothetical protein